MAPETLTLRNLSATPLTIVSIANFPILKPPGPRPITARTLTDFGNLAHHLSVVLRTTGIAPAPQPSNRSVAENAKAFAERDACVAVQPFRAAETDIPVRAGEVLRLVFEAEDRDGARARFRTDLGSGSSAVHCLTPATALRFNGIFHASHAHLAVFSAAALDAWQARLRDETPLAAISIPGTHNSPTCYRALPSVRCQAVGIPAQLRNGIRFLDIRCQVESDGELTLVHGAFPITLAPPPLAAQRLRHVLADIYAFLDAHPLECVIVSLKREGRGSATDETFAAHLRAKYIEPQQHRWWTAAAAGGEGGVLRLGDVRGKCILFRRFASPRWNAGINAEHWRYNSADTATPTGTCRVQDFCEVLEPPSIARKIEYVKEHLERSAATTTTTAAAAAHAGGGGGKPLYLNFLSGSNFWKVGCWPERVAQRVNVEVARHLAVHHVAGRNAGDGATGVVVCDYVGERGEWDLVRLVIAMNAWIEKST